MSRPVWGTLAVAVLSFQIPALSQMAAPPNEAIYLTDEEIKAVNAGPSTDKQLRVVDMGKYNLAVGILHRGPTGAARAGGAGGGGGAARGATPPPVPCGGTPSGKPSGVSGIAHDATTETYVITSGGGKLVTGGFIVGGTRSAPEGEVTQILNGPSCSGPIEGNFVSRVVKTGDVIIIPANVPHGWTEITDHVDYLSVRPDPDKVLRAGYVHPMLQKK